MKFEGLEPWHCEGIEGIVAPEIGPKSFGTFERQAPGHQLCLKSSQTKQMMLHLDADKLVFCDSTNL